MAKPPSLASIALFLGFAYGFAIAVGLVAFVNGGDFRSPAAGIAVTMMMFSPSLGAVLATKLVNRDSLRVNRIAKGRLRHYLLAWGYPLVVILIGLVLVSLLRIATVDFNNFARILPSGLDKILAIATTKVCGSSGAHHHTFFSAKLTRSNQYPYRLLHTYIVT